MRQSSGLFGLSSGQHGRLMNKRSRVRFLSLKRVIFPPCPFYANLTFPGRPWNGNPSEWTRAAPTFESPSPSSWSAPSSSWSAPSSSWSAPSNSWSAPSSSWSAQTYGGNGGGKEHSQLLDSNKSQAAMLPILQLYTTSSYLCSFQLQARQEYLFWTLTVTVPLAYSHFRSRLCGSKGQCQNLCTAVV